MLSETNDPVKKSQNTLNKGDTKLPFAMKLAPKTTGETNILDMEKARPDAELQEFLITFLRVGVLPPNRLTSFRQTVHSLISAAQ